MATRNIPFPDKVRDMVLDVIKHVRRQEYTPEQLCQLQKIIECKYFYWWCMDMKKEEYVMELFTDDFRYYLNGHLAVKDKLLQARNAKWCNKDMQTMHMGHQPMIWLIDDTHARGVFQYEDHMCYYDDSLYVFPSSKFSLRKILTHRLLYIYLSNKYVFRLIHPSYNSKMPSLHP